MPSSGLLDTCVYVNVCVFLTHMIVHEEKHLILNLTTKTSFKRSYVFIN